MKAVYNLGACPLMYRSDLMEEMYGQRVRQEKCFNFPISQRGKLFAYVFLAQVLKCCLNAKQKRLTTILY